MANSTGIELDTQVIQLKVEMDNIVESIKGIDYELLELEALFKAQIEQLKERFEEKQYLLKEKREKLQIQLRVLFEQVPQSETKTQRKVKLFNGEVVVKKARLDFEKDGDKLLEWAKENNRDELINRKEVLSFKWADFKKRLVPTDCGIVDVETGETLEIDGLISVTKAEELEIKY
ncbi:MAG: host-nuclease inhibitor Gam family protein [Candidatus Niameybacter stercoravium]|nr:host-nuclease inhibitor Gam family protein [Candidatus Niameybacter stercoravium]